MNGVARRRALGAAVFVVAALLLPACGEREAAGGGEAQAALRAAFQAGRGKPRIVALMSPT